MASFGVFMASYKITKNLGLKIGRATAQPESCIESVNEDVVDLGRFKIHIFTPKEQCDKKI